MPSGSLGDYGFRTWTSRFYGLGLQGVEIQGLKNSVLVADL